MTQDVVQARRGGHRGSDLGSDVGYLSSLERLDDERRFLRIGIIISNNDDDGGLRTLFSI